jgi:hypothetical protein
MVFPVDNRVVQKLQFLNNNRLETMQQTIGTNEQTIWGQENFPG